MSAPTRAVDADVVIDPAARVVVLVTHDALQLEPVRLALPFDLVKAIACGVLQAELAGARAPAGPQLVRPDGSPT